MTAIEHIGHDGKSEVPQVWDAITEEDRGRYLEALRDGAGLDIAAREIGYTASRMRRFSNRDSTWKELVATAYAEGQEYHRDKLREAAGKRALEVSDRMLEVELATHVPGYEHLRRNRMHIDAKVDSRTLVISLDPAVLDQMPPEKLAEIEAALAALEGEIIDADAVEEP